MAEACHRMVEVGEHIATAETPPGAAYLDPSVFQVELETIFSRAWLGLVPVAIPAGSAHPFDLLPGALDESLVMTADGNGFRRVLSNVCTHRGMKVVTATGPTRTLRCGYHGRRFGIDGRLEAAPGFEGAQEFPRPCDHLSSAGLAAWGPASFVRLLPGMPFADWIGPAREWFDFLPLDALAHDPSGDRRFVVSANWKLYLDNYLEGFHIPTVHKSLASALDLSAYRTELLPHGSMQIGVASKEPVLPIGSTHPLSGESIGALYLHLFPNTLFNVYPWGVSLNLVNPVTPTTTEVLFHRYVWKPELVDQGAGADLDRVEAEDEAVVEATQRGLRSRLYKRGRYSPRHETAVHHFHRWWSTQLAGSHGTNQ